MVETAEHFTSVPATESPDTAATVAASVTDVTTAGAGVVLDRYRLVRRIGSGGFGAVWLAHDERLDRAVAVKRIPVAGKGARTRAEREAVAAARLSHPGIVTLYEAGHDDDAVYLVSELVRGRTLAQLLADGELSDLDAVEAGIALCDALAHAHGRGVIHRDVKPANVIVPEVEGDPTASAAAAAKLTDFGIARVLGDEALTATGDIVGTLAYMAPEQADGRPATAATDLYAAALVTYEALCGINPIRGTGAAATARRVGVRLPALSRMRRDLPPGLCRALDRAVAPDPADRGSLADLRAALLLARNDVDDTPGTIAPARVDRISRQTVRAAARVEEWTVARGAYAGREYEVDDGVWDGRDEDGVDRRPPVAAARAGAGVAAGALVAGALTGLGPSPGMPVLLVCSLVAVLVAALPRAGWAIAAGGVIVWTAADQPGTAVVLAAATLPVTLLLPLRGRRWSAPAGAPLLGLLGAAAVWPALAGQCRRGVDRAGLAALGCWWLLLAQALLGRKLLLATLPGARPRQGWEGSAADAVNHLLVPLFTSGVLVVAVWWALAAAVLPLLVRGRQASVDIVAATAWAASLAAGTAWVLHLVDPAGVIRPQGIVVGAVLGGLVAVGARAVRGGA